MTSRSLDRWIASVLLLGYVLLLVKTASSLGYARDEGFYFHAAAAYRGWFELLLNDSAAAFDRVNVDRFFAVNREHPVFMKLAFMGSHALLHEALPVFDEAGTAYRFPGMILSGIAVAVIYLWGSQALGRGAGLIAALSFALMPRVFYHAHLACFDLPIASLLLCTGYAYMRSLETRSLGWVLVTGLLYGLSLNTKHNAWLLPFALVLHFLAFSGRAFFRDIRRARLRIPAGMISMAALGPLVLFVGWPWLWFDTVERFTDYVRFHTSHDYYNMEFLGQTYWRPPMPRAYAWVMTLGTVPLVTLLLFVAGVSLALHGWFRQSAGRTPDNPPHASLTGLIPTQVFWVFCVLVSYAPWWFSDTPIFGGTKHWMTAYPFLCLLAGSGFSAVVAAVRDAPWTSRHRLERACAPLLGASVLLGPAAMTANSHPWGLSAYTPLVGGAPGAASLGLNRTFWGYTTGSLTATLNELALPGARVYLHDTAVSSWEMLRRDGRVRQDLQGTLAIHESDWALYHHEPHMGRVEYQIWVNYGTAAPVAIATHDGVPVAWLYQRPQRRDMR